MESTVRLLEVSALKEQGPPVAQPGMAATSPSYQKSLPLLD